MHDASDALLLLRTSALWNASEYYCHSTAYGAYSVGDWRGAAGPHSVIGECFMPDTCICLRENSGHI